MPEDLLGLAALGIKTPVLLRTERKITILGRLTTAAGTNQLLRAVRNPLLSEHLGSLADFWKAPLATAKSCWHDLNVILMFLGEHQDDKFVGCCLHRCSVR